MRDFVITTDNTSDLPSDYVEKYDIGIAYLTTILEGVEYKGKDALDPKDFYNKVREGAMPTTSQINQAEAMEFFRPYLEEGKDILHVAFSSGLSGTYSSMVIAAEELKEEFPEANILIVDTLAASMGEGLLVHHALRLKREGKSIQEIYEWLIHNRFHMAHLFTVDDLFHLHRGGRVSKAVAIVGSVMNIKPVLHVDDEGHLTALSNKVRGRKKSIQTLEKLMEERIGDHIDKNDVIMISHGDCIEDANYLKSLIEEKYGEHEFLMNYVGPTIGAHSGPGTLALFFLGEHR